MWALVACPAPRRSRPRSLGCPDVASTLPFTAQEKISFFQKELDQSPFRSPDTSYTGSSPWKRRLRYLSNSYRLWDASSPANPTASRKKDCGLRIARFGCFNSWRARIKFLHPKRRFYLVVYVYDYTSR